MMINIIQVFETTFHSQSTSFNMESKLLWQNNIVIGRLVTAKILLLYTI